MSLMKIPDITDRDLDDFEKLTCQESHSVPGQILKMEMVEKIIRERDELHRRAVTSEMKGKGFTGQELTDEVQKRVQNIRISRMQLGDGRFNLIVEKGDTDPDNEDPSAYRIMIPAHVDTVDMGAPTSLVHDAQFPDRVRGQGVYDMGAAVLNSIDLAVSAHVPRGMKAYFVFTVDEETNSVGARELIEQWQLWPMIDVVVSSEIGPLPPATDEDSPIRLITARAGRLKFIGSMSVDHRMQGHGSEDNMPNASKALRHFLNSIDSRFYDGYEDPNTHEKEPKQQRMHPLLGGETIEDGNIAGWKERQGYVPPDRAEYEFAVKMVPPSSQLEYQQAFMRWAKGIAKRGQWGKFGINNTMTRNPHVASYSPYEMPADHAVVQIASGVIERMSGVAPDIVGAPSVADECDYAEAGKPVITIPPNGDEAHHPDEWVSLRSVLVTREIIRQLIEADDGFRMLMQQKEKKE